VLFSTRIQEDITPDNYSFSGSMLGYLGKYVSGKKERTDNGQI